MLPEKFVTWGHKETPIDNLWNSFLQNFRSEKNVQEKILAQKGIQDIADAIEASTLIEKYKEPQQVGSGINKAIQTFYTFKNSYPLRHHDLGDIPTWCIEINQPNCEDHYHMFFGQQDPSINIHYSNFAAVYLNIWPKEDKYDFKRLGLFTQCLTKENRKQGFISANVWPQNVKRLPFLSTHPQL